jgi:hypothetical protein
MSCSKEDIVTWRDKLELGLKEDAPYRKDNLPASQIRGPEISNGPGRSPEIPAARGDKNQPGPQPDANQASPATNPIIHPRNARRARRGANK